MKSVSTLARGRVELRRQLMRSLMRHKLRTQHHQRHVGLEPLVKVVLVEPRDDDQLARRNHLREIDTRHGRRKRRKRRFHHNDERITAKPSMQRTNVITQPKSENRNAELVLDIDTVGKARRLRFRIVPAVQPTHSAIGLPERGPSADRTWPVWCQAIAPQASRRSVAPMHCRVAKGPPCSAHRSGLTDAGPARCCCRIVVSVAVVMGAEQVRAQRIRGYAIPVNRQNWPKDSTHSAADRDTQSAESRQRRTA